MTFEDLINDIANYESADLEFKSAKGGLPQSMWETYSSFANTQGGVIYLGVKEKNHHFSVDGLTRDQIEDYKKLLWDGLNNRQKTSHNLLEMEDDIEALETTDGWVLRINVPRADLTVRPIYINRNREAVYKRKNEGDYLCQDKDIRRMYAESNILEVSQDSGILKGFSFENDIDPQSFREYRQIFADRKASHPWASLPDLEFLNKLGGYRVDKRTGEEGLTIAGMLMFGKYDSIVDEACIPSFFPDYREYLDPDPNARWSNRIYPDGTWEANLFQFFRRVYNRLQHALPSPFALKAGMRIEDSPTHVALREGFANSLIHCDYTVNASLITEKHRTKFVFSNPGSLLISLDQYFRGGESVCRNRALQKMFMMIGYAEKAGSGADKIWSGWKEGNFRIPSIIERDGRVILEMPLVDILSEDVKDVLLKRFGESVLKIDHNKLIALATCASDGFVTNNRMQFVLTAHPSDITDMLKDLCQEGYLIQTGFGKGTKYQLTQGLSGNKNYSIQGVSLIDYVGSSTDNLGSYSSYLGSSPDNLGGSPDNLGGSELPSKGDTIRRRREKPEQLRQRILKSCPDYIPMSEIAQRVKKNLTYLQGIISAMVAEGLLERKYPDVPTHPNQQYRAYSKDNQ